MEKKNRVTINWILFFVSLIVVFVLGLLASSITERRAEAVFAYTPQNKIANFEPRNEVWGENFPREFESYYQTEDSSFFSKYNGGGMIDMLEVDPRLVVLWAGYGFSKDYSQGRGHYYAIDDIRNTLRTGGPMKPNKGPMPTTCWTCKSPDVPRIMNKEGVAEFYTGKWARLGSEIINPIGCADCHDPETQDLKISRPALVEGFKALGKDITKATHQEIRSLVCAQCHVEYYFNKNKVKGSNYLTFPWADGLTCEDAEKYYDNLNFKDWTHKLSKAPMLKAQHPGYEMYLTGIHAKRGVSCADCHMPYRSEGGVKFTDHKIQSPLNNVESTCQVCHREKTDQLIADVYERQDKILENRDKLEEFIVRAHVEAMKAWEIGANEQQMKDILLGIRHAQWRWDYAAAAHGNSFHSPVETGRLISSGMVKIQETRIKLARLLADLGYNNEVQYPDISTKAKAQKFIGLDMEKLNNDKTMFLDIIVQEWIMEAEERESKMNI